MSWIHCALHHSKCLSSCGLTYSRQTILGKRATGQFTSLYRYIASEAESGPGRDHSFRKGNANTRKLQYKEKSPGNANITKQKEYTEAGVKYNTEPRNMSKLHHKRRDDKIVSRVREEEAVRRAVNTSQDRKATEVNDSEWSETFGTLNQDEMDVESESTLFDFEENLPELLEAEKEKTPYEHVPLGRFNRKHSPPWYVNKILQLGKKGDIKKAIEVFDKWMIEQDRVRPTRTTYFVLIRLLAQCGYVTKAFSLYNQMVRSGCGKASPALYTCLFNACANSPIRHIGLEKATQLRQHMLMTGEQPNYVTYQAMIKAFGICGDINTAFTLADEAAQIKVTDNLLASLLGACVNDKEAGFRHAVLVWRKFRKMGLKPALHHYNLLLRTVNECGVGKQGFSPELLQFDTCGISGGREKKRGLTGKGAVDVTFEKQKQIETFRDIDSALAKYERVDDSVGGNSELHLTEESSSNVTCEHVGDDQSYEQTSDNVDHNCSEIVEVQNSSEQEVSENKEWWELDIFSDTDTSRSLEKHIPRLPNVLEIDEDFSSLVHVGMMTKSYERFALLGGLDGFLETLRKNDISGDLVTFTQLIKAVPYQMENEIVVAMKVAGVQADTDFYNHLIYRRAKYHKQQAVKAYKMLKADGLQPNLRTFGCLALACESKGRAQRLLEDMDNAGLTPNAWILSQMLTANAHNFYYQKELLRLMQELGIKPTKYVINAVEDNIAMAKIFLSNKERHQKRRNDQKKVKYEPNLEESLSHFLLFYDTWTKYNVIAETPHPWQAFRDSKPPVDK